MEGESPVLKESDFFLRSRSVGGEMSAPWFRQLLQCPGRLWRTVLWRVANLAELFLPAECQHDPELARRARLVARFGILGAVFGAFFGLFYGVIGHFWGAGIVTICSTAFGFIPLLMRRTRSIHHPPPGLLGVDLLAKPRAPPPPPPRAPPP